jgi:hypothetical protein
VGKTEQYQLVQTSQSDVKSQKPTRDCTPHDGQGSRYAQIAWNTFEQSTEHQIPEINRQKLLICSDSQPGHSAFKDCQLPKLSTFSARRHWKGWSVSCKDPTSLASTTRAWTHEAAVKMSATAGPGVGKASLGRDTKTIEARDHAWQERLVRPSLLQKSNLKAVSHIDAGSAIEPSETPAAPRRTLGLFVSLSVHQSVLFRVCGFVFALNSFCRGPSLDPRLRVTR